MKLKHTCVLLAALMTISLFLTGCGAGNAADGQDIPSSAGGTVSASPQDADNLASYSGDLGWEYAEEDLDSSWDDTTATMIELSGNSAEVSGSGAVVAGNTVSIQSAGTYVLTGSMSDGQVIIDAGKDDLVRLVLNGVTMSNSQSAPVYSKQSGKTVVILAEGTENTITDAAQYVYAADEDEPDAAIFAKDNLTITGSGSLNVTGNYKNAIGSKDYLVITGGTITVSAVNDGLRGRDGVAILDGVFTIKAENDGIKSNNDEDEAKGFIVIDGGTFDIASGHDAVQAETSLLVNGGLFNIFTGGGAASAPVKQENFRNWGSSDTSSSTDSESLKGLKAGTLVTVNAGTFVIDSEDDALHSNGDLVINGGSFDISTGDDAFHADGALTVNDGQILIKTSYEGLEGATVDINGGDISIKASDDGINAAGGSDGGAQGPMGFDRFNSGNSSYYIRITGGRIYVDAGGDGIDSNGALYIDGGEIYVDGPTSGADTAIDTDGSIEISGGVMVAAGSSGMLVYPSSSSTQPSIVVTYTSAQAAGAILTLKDQSGGIVLTFTSSKSYSAAIITSPDLKTGETYELYAGDSKLTDITLSDTVTTLSSDGSAIAGGQGGFGGMGGNRPGRGGNQDGEAPALPDGMDEGMLPGRVRPGDGEAPTLPDGMEGNMPERGSAGPGGDMTPPDIAGQLPEGGGGQT